MNSFCCCFKHPQITDADTHTHYGHNVKWGMSLFTVWVIFNGAREHRQGSNSIKDMTLVHTIRLWMPLFTRNRKKDSGMIVLMQIGGADGGDWQIMSRLSFRFTHQNEEFRMNKQTQKKKK